MKDLKDLLNLSFYDDQWAAPEFVEVSTIETANKYQHRHAMPDTATYGELYRGSVKYPFRDPIMLAKVGAKTYVIDGHQRLEAAKAQNRTEVLCRVRKCSATEAEWLSLKANSEHGSKRTVAEQRDVILRIYARAPDFTVNQIAKAAGTTYYLTKKVISEFLEASEQEVEQSDVEIIEELPDGGAVESTAESTAESNGKGTGPVLKKPRKPPAGRGGRPKKQQQAESQEAEPAEQVEQPAEDTKLTSEDWEPVPASSGKVDQKLKKINACSSHAGRLLRALKEAGLWGQCEAAMESILNEISKAAK